MSPSVQCEILLVEDNECDAELAIRALKKRNLANRLVHVRDGAEALAYLFGTGTYSGRNLNQHPKVILLDLKLPKLDGLAVLREIKANASTKTIPVIIMASSKEHPDVAESYKLGANGYVVKPVDFANFSKAVSELGCYWVLLNHPPPTLARNESFVSSDPGV